MRRRGDGIHGSRSAIHLGATIATVLFFVLLPVPTDGQESETGTPTADQQNIPMRLYLIQYDRYQERIILHIGPGIARNRQKNDCSQNGCKGKIVR